jgi:hypothetical protein
MESNGKKYKLKVRLPCDIAVVLSFIELGIEETMI